MKRREGTLEHIAFSTEDGDDMAEALRVCVEIGVVGFEDFMQKAAALADAILERHELPAGWHGPEVPAELSTRKKLEAFALEVGVAVKLKGELYRMRTFLQSPNLAHVSEAMECAVNAGIYWSSLKNEERDDARARGRFSRAEYQAAKSQTETHDDLAVELGVTLEALRQWEHNHMPDRVPRKPGRPAKKKAK